MADGSQYLVTEQRSQVARGETASSRHEQTVEYNELTDRTITNRTHPKIVTQTQAHADGASDDSEATTKVPRSMQVSFTVDLLGTTILC
jgi:hypothetical protein